MLISDLPHFENISPDEVILGGSLLALIATASVDGGTTLTTTDVVLKNNGPVTLAKGKGTALAIGTDPLADVDFYCEGFDKVKVKTISRSGQNYDFEMLRIMAIDLPH